MERLGRYGLLQPHRGRTALIWIRIVPPCAPAIVTVTTFVRNAVTRLPITPLVAPAGSVPAASRAVTHQLHRQRRTKLNRARIGRERGRLSCWPPRLGRQQSPDEGAHCCLQREPTRIVGHCSLTNREAASVLALGRHNHLLVGNLNELRKGRLAIPLRPNAGEIGFRANDARRGSSGVRAHAATGCRTSSRQILKVRQCLRFNFRGHTCQENQR